ncbi:bacteriophage P2 gpD protein [Novosphingobium nitrogenifigens DSM 19370]|uniref:Bacteriophage P2 gpD protein n=2 Tax=Novosphingobium nitrogenifigens TaxID=378548 RepID=F1Z9D0_9SPHN|nr:bacteriophage P2 gpD protein [Novosphingobium nitrogenifigens DSM 19370]
MAGQAYVQPFAAWRVLLGTVDLTTKLAPRLSSLTLTEARGEEADSLELVLHDTDGALALPPAGAVLHVALGWQRGTGVAVGLVDKGSYIVQDVEWQGGEPDLVTIRARSADLRTTLQNRRNRMFTGQTIGAIVTQVARDNALTPRCHPDLANTVVGSIEQANTSDITFLRDLARRYDAAATVKAGCLLFTPIGAATTATGAKLPTLKLARRDCASPHYSRAARENTQDGAEAQYHDPHKGRRITVGHGGHHRRRMKRVYATADDAKAAAKGEHARITRAEARLSLILPYGRAAIGPGVRIAASGFKTEIDAHAWLVTSVRHEIMPGGGFSTTIEMEVTG